MVCDSTPAQCPSKTLNTGWEMPLVGLGTYKIADQSAMDLAVDAALGEGYRLFDTAKLYNNEHLLGTSLKKLLPIYGLRRENIFITTKFFPVLGNEAKTLVPKLIIDSLRDLNTSYIDLVLIHYPKPEQSANDDHEGNFESRQQNWLELEKFSSNVIHSIGVSSYEVCHLKEIAKYTSKVPAVNQVEYHPHFRRNSVKEYCKEKGIFFQAFSSLGRRTPDLMEDPTIIELGRKYKTSLEIILLSFAVSQNVGVIPKSSNPDRIRDNFKCSILKLESDDIKKLNSIDKNAHYIRPTPWLVS